MINTEGRSILFSIAVGMGVLSMVNVYGPAEIAFQFLTRDKVVLDIYTERDILGLLEGYTTHVKTPVCEEGSCYEVELDFYWDVLGNFIRYDYDPEKPLTKLDHQPFNAGDYEKLQEILETTSPSFIHLRREELIVKPIGDREDVDAMSGATVQSVKADMVEGAIFTCYTLWHIANGGIIFEIGEHTRKTLNDELISKFLNAKDSRLAYFLVENMHPAQYASNIGSLLSAAENFDPYYISRMLESIPNEMINEPFVQEFFRQRFDRMDVETRSNFLARLTNAAITEITKTHLVEEILPGRSRNNDLIIQLIAGNEGSDSNLLEKMLTRMHQKGVHPSLDSYSVLEKAVKGDRKLRKLLKGLSN